jgi:hypothetical protein
MGPGGSHGLQNRRDPTRSGWVGSIPTRSRHAAIAIALLSAITAGAQQQDSAQVGVKRQPAHRAPPHADTIKGPPIPPGRAFLYSLLVPGLGQAKLDRAWTGALFAGVEVLAISRWEQAAKDLKYAETHRSDSIALYDSVINGVIQINDTTGGPIEVNAYNPYSSTRVGARKLHVEDWIAVIIFNHLISGADAFVEAQLWDLPSRIQAERAPDGSTIIAISLPIRAPPL